MTNKEYAEKDQNFIELCKNNNVKPTVRQASKFLRGFGLLNLTMTLHGEQILKRSQKLDPLFQVKGLERYHRRYLAKKNHIF